MDYSYHNLTTDAALSSQNADLRTFLTHNSRLISEIHIEDLSLLELDLADYEKISMIFLLYGSDFQLVNTGLQHILLQLTKPTKNSTYLYQWARNKLSMNVEWREMLVESLCISQAYHVTDKLGLYKQALEEYYKPYVFNDSLYINKFIKALYILAESFEVATAKKLIKYVGQELKGAKSSFNNPQYLEVYYLQWIQHKVIQLHEMTTCQINVILQFLTNEGLKNERKELESMLIDEIKKKPIKIKENIEVSFNEIQRETNCYRVTRDKCGFALIINQKEFNKEPNYNGLKDYNVRTGTEHDRDRLKVTFQIRGYQVIIKENLNHTAIKEQIKKIVDASTCYDSLIVCILSHGEDGYIISSNCIPIPISEIQKLMASEKLIHKPKMLIIQACQGGAPQTLVKTVTVEEIETDGQAETTSSPHADLLTALSTISGFASFRDRIKGTWYIQELCQVIDDLGDSNHMLDLLITVNDKVSQKSAHKDGKIVGQLPEAKITLRRKFFLPKRN